jgi:WD40 repeat protein
MKKSPYKFLDSYSKEDRNIFFGRDKEIEELHSRVFESRIMIVYGTSGTGKSSLINCGLANKFNDSDWLPVTIRRNGNINRSLYESLCRTGLTEISSAKKDFSENKGNDILKLIRSIYLDHFKPIFLVFDQFEELFIFGNNDERDELISNIKKVVDSDLQCRFVFSVREEYLAGFTDFEKIIPSFLANRIRIEKMTRHNAIKAIEGPCELKGITVEPGFSEMLLDKLNPDNPDVELTYLQVYLDKVFQIASEDGDEVNEFSKKYIDRAGEVKDLLGTFLEEQVSKLDDPESGMMILKSFVSAKGTRHQITAEEVIEYSRNTGKEIDIEKAVGLIQNFIHLRILRDKDENSRYELRHDSLAQRIYEKITMVEKELLEIRQFIENAFHRFEKRQLYLTNVDLNYIAPYEERLFLNEKLQRFIFQSKWSIHKDRRRKQNAFIITTISLIAVLSFFSIWALKERSNAMNQTNIAEMQKNAALKAKEEAESAKQTALISKNLAVEKENQAIFAQKQSDEARKEAISERENALHQKSLAEKLTITASEQAQIANDEKISAERERLKAINSESRARRLSMLSTAQNLALKSSAIEGTPELMGLLAVQAFIFNKNNGGRTEDPIIFEALNKAYLSIDSSRHSVYKGSPNEIRILREQKNGSILSADLDGFIRRWTRDGKNNNIHKLASSSPINYIGASSTGELLLTQHDNSELILWDTRSGSKYIPDFKNITGHTGYVRTISLSRDEKYLATAGRDSSVIIWDFNYEKPLKINSFKTNSEVRAMVFCSTDSLYTVTTDGSIILWNLNRNEETLLYKSESDIPLSLAWNYPKKILISGCSEGSLLVFNSIQGNGMQPKKYSVHSAGIDLITFNSDFSLMATSSRDKTIKYFNWHEFFELDNAVGGSEHFRNLSSRVRSLIFTSDNMLVAGLADKSIRVWETSSEKLASMICALVKRNMTVAEWNEMAGTEIPYECTCVKDR